MFSDIFPNLILNSFTKSKSLNLLTHSFPTTILLLKINNLSDNYTRLKIEDIRSPSAVAIILINNTNIEFYHIEHN